MKTISLYKNDNPRSFLLGKNEVHIWNARLDVPEPQVKKWWLYLSPDEVLRANRFHFVEDKNHFIVARGVLRKVLSYYVNKQPYEIQFEYNRYGKPILKRESGDAPIRFNLSHSHGVALYAIASNQRVGIDIEYIREEFSDLEIANRFFSKDEVAALKSLRPAVQKKAFFLCWTRKEAFIKAIGKGLGIPLDQFDVSLTPNQPAKLLKTRFDRSEASRWSLFNIDLFPDYAAALAVEGKNMHMEFRASDEF